MKTPSILIVISMAAMPMAQAAKRTYVGGGADTNWGTTANWNPAAAPVAGDELFFVSGAQASNNNRTAGTIFHDLNFSARHTLTGNPFALSTGLVVAAPRSAVTINPSITLSGPQTFSITGGALECVGSLLLNGQVLTTDVGASHELILSGIVGGTGASSIVKSGLGTLRLGNVVINAGGISSSAGVLDLDGATFSGNTTTLSGGQLTGTGTLDVLNASGCEIIPSGGDLTVSNGLALAADVKLTVALTGPGASSAMVGFGAVSLSNAELVIDASTYQPAYNETFTIMTVGTGPRTGTFKNLPQNAEVVINATTVGRITYVGGNGNDIQITVISTTRTWDGGNFLNDNWDEAENWTGNIAPHAGDVLVFPAGIQNSDLGMDNNFPSNTTFRQIVHKGDGYTIRGAPFKLSHGMIMDNVEGVPNQLNLDTPITLAADQEFHFVEVAGGNGALDSPPVLHMDLLDEINLGGHTLKLRGFGVIEGKFTGGGGITVSQGGHFIVRGGNNYTGETIIESNASLDLNHEDGLGTNAGDTQIRGGSLKIEADLPAQHFNIGDQLIMDDGATLYSIGAGGLVGATQAHLEYSGGMQFRGNGSVLLSANTSVNTFGAAKHEIDGSMTSAGGTMGVHTEGEWLISGTSSNTAGGSFLIDEGSVTLAKTAGVTALAFPQITLNGGSDLFIEANEQIANASNLTLNGDLHLGTTTPRTETIGNLNIVAGRVDGPTGSLLILNGDIGSILAEFASRQNTIDVKLQVQKATTQLSCGNEQNNDNDTDPDFVFTKSVVRTGSASILRTGPGRVAFQDSVSVPCELHEGTTLFNGLSGTTAIMRLTGGTIGGTGMIGNLLGQTGGGIVAPGESSPGTFSCRNVQWNAETKLQIEVGVTTLPNGYDKLNVTGSVSLGNAALEILRLPTSGIANGFQLTILENDGTDAIIGTFANLSEGTFIRDATGTAGYLISYKGTNGTGNDVVLTRLATSPYTARLTTISFSKGTGPNGNNLVTLGGTAGPNDVRLVEASSNLLDWVPVQTVNANDQGVITLTIDVSPGLTKRFFRVQP